MHGFFFGYVDSITYKSNTSQNPSPILYNLQQTTWVKGSTIFQWSPFLWLEYMEFGGTEMTPDAKFHLTQVPVVL